MEKHTFGYEKDYLKGFDSSKCFGYLEEAEMDYKEYIGAFIEDYIYNEKDIKKNDNLLDKLYENALIKFNYLSVSDNEIKDFVDNELKNMIGFVFE